MAARGDAPRLQIHRGDEVEGDPRVDGPGGGWGDWLSVIIPARNEAKNLPILVAEVVASLRPILGEGRGPRRLDGFDVVVVDDGSDDETPAILRAMATIYPELRPIRLTRNHGQSGATAAGFRVARGGYVALLDADLQNDPADLVRLWDALTGFDAALGWRRTREDGWRRRVVSRWANRIRNLVLDQEIRDTGCSVRIIPREIAARLPAFQGFHRFLGPLLIREGCRVVQVPVDHRPRRHGRSHYHLGNRSIRVVVDLLGVAWLMARPVAIGEIVDLAADQVPGARRYVNRGA